ncbi:rhodanese-like domain-containing protein [Euzebya sp.]|uniref:rhodanese-like domain-containing protein n=1 Tax=Euzebya sp. TaxID=1971409 RepID=UPI0035138E0C
MRLATDGEVAVVIDPQRDHDRVLAITGARGLRITHVLETHIHNDYVTGGYALAREVGATYVVSAGDEVAYDRVPAEDGDVLQAGRMQIRVLSTPGHTFTHLSYAIAVGDEAPAVFSGGSLLYGSTGRPDLLGTEHAQALARAQHRSAHRLLDELPRAAALFPTHGFGSFYSATQSEEDSSTLEREAATNPALTTDEDAFVAEILAGLDAYPAYYAHMAPANAAGPAAPDLSPPTPAEPAEIRRRLDAGEWVVDLRTRTAFSTGHVRGTINLGLDGSFITYLGWLIPWGTPVTLLAETAEDVAQVQRDMARIGIDRPAAAATGGPADWTGGAVLDQQSTATFADLAAAAVRPVVLDVRRDLERQGSHLPGSLHIPLQDLLARLDEVPEDVEVWVHCAAGYRASLAASLLRRAGRRTVLVDDEFDRAVALGLTTTVAAA